ncbi:MAG: hypoxanthine phosphoribosyltransferase [Erysipelotrichia bacterium]|nr:hypoxanthine phosphoribosyltransferase [Erysipelotrichia bacterium]NCC54948.1 hypoxanthine phosphoribosyltransferase [Erysipelotrichia bacterium]
MHKDVEEILVFHDEIIKRCDELGKQISEDYNKEKKVPLLVALLKGSIPFLSELMQHINIDGIEFDVMDVSSYDGAESIGDVRINKDLSTSVKGISVLLVEDIVDTGRTLKEVKKLLLNKEASDVKVVSLLDKPERRIVEDMEAEYVGFTIKNEFVIGYGLDYNQKYRNLPYVGVLKRSVYE